MLKLEQLYDESFEDVVEAAKKQIRQIYPEWDNLTTYDPGVTLLELFSWLKLAQEDYMSHLFTATEYRFLRFFSVERRRNSAAALYMQLHTQRDLDLPKGTSFTYEGLCFQMQNRTSVSANELCKAVTVADEKISAEIPFKDTAFERSFYPFGAQPMQGNQLILLFKRPFAVGREISFYVQNRYHKSRNPLGDSPFFSPIDLHWEVYNGVGWSTIAQVEDTTHGLLFDGMLRLVIPAQMQEWQSGEYAVRAVVDRCEADVYPQLSGIQCNAAIFLQKEQGASFQIFQKKELRDGEVSLYDCNAIYGSQSVFLWDKEEQGYALCDDWKKAIELEATQKCVLTLGKAAMEQLAPLQEEDPAVLVMSKELAETAVLGSGAGFSNQIFSLPFSDLLYEDFQILVAEQTKSGLRYQIWDKTDDFFLSDPYAKHYRLDVKEKHIRFGDHEFGESLPEGEDNVLLLSMSTSQCEEGNLRSGMIQRVPIERQQDVFASQITAAAGGAAEETLAQTKARLQQVQNGRRHRIVTAADYSAAVRETPGLIVDTVRVIPNFLPKDAKYPQKDRSNAVTLVVGNEEDARLPLSQSYLKTIDAYLEPLRLITTNLAIANIHYIGIDFLGEIMVKPYYENAAALIEEELRARIKESNQEENDTLYYGEVCGWMDRLDCVLSVGNLNMEPCGEGVEKTAIGDIKIPRDGVFYLNTFSISLVSGFE